MPIHTKDNGGVLAWGEFSSEDAESGESKFKFWSDDVPEYNEEIEAEVRESLDAKKMVATCEYTFKPVPADKSSYNIQYAFFTADGKQMGKKHEFQIWPSKGSLTVKDEEGTAIDNFNFKMKQRAFEPGGGLPSYDEKDVEINGGGVNGKYTFSLNPGSEYTIQALPPWKIIESKANSISQREINVELCIIAEFFNPLGQESNGKPLKIYNQEAKDKATASPPTLRQYVNCDSTRNGWDAKGHEVIIEVGVQGDKSKSLDQRAGGSGKFIYVRIKFSGVGGDDKKSKREVPETEPKPGLNITDIKKVGGKKAEYTGKVELASNNNTGEFKVELGYAGGDTCQIQISGTEDFPAGYADATLNIENWRRLEYELLYPDIMKNLSKVNGMKDIPAAIKAKVDERLAEVYIEYSLYKSHEFTNKTPSGFFSLFSKSKPKLIKNEDHRYCFTNSQILGEEGKAKDRFYMDDFLFEKLLEANAIEGISLSTSSTNTRIKIILAHYAFSSKLDESAEEIKSIRYPYVKYMEKQTESIKGFFPPQESFVGRKH